MADGQGETVSGHRKMTPPHGKNISGLCQHSFRLKLNDPAASCEVLRWHDKGIEASFEELNQGQAARLLKL